MFCWTRFHIINVMIIILLYSAAILIETILLVNYHRLRLVEVRLPEPCSSLVNHLNIFYGNINNKSFEVSDTLFQRSVECFFWSIKQKTHDSQNSLVVCISETYRLNLMFKKTVSHAADFFAFLIHKVVCFLFCLCTIWFCWATLYL